MKKFYTYIIMVLMIMVISDGIIENITTVQIENDQAMDFIEYNEENNDVEKLIIKDENYEKWIDRISVPEWGFDFYNILEEYTNNDGVNDLLIAEDGFNIENAFVLKTNEKVCIFNGIKAASTTPCSSEEVQNIFDNIRSIYLCFLMDHPEVFWLNGTVKMYCYQTSYQYDYYLVTRWHDESEEAFDIRPVKYQNEKYLADTINEMNNKIYDILYTEEINEYNHNPIIDDLIYENNSHSCLGALFCQDGEDAPVCESYAKAFKVLCDKLDIPCTLSIGDGISFDDSDVHEWNLVQLEGAWYAVDVTWDDPVMQNQHEKISGYESEDYFLVGSDTLINGIKFSDSHKTINKLTEKDMEMKNEPLINEEKYEK